MQKHLPGGPPPGVRSFCSETWMASGAGAPAFDSVALRHD